MPTRFFTLLLVTALLGACSKTPVRLQTPHGDLLGYIDEHVEHYLGVPYALPPVGDLRWRPPQPARDWQGTRDAQHNSDICAQFSPMSGNLVGNEDCLYLNIWTPDIDSDEPLPVMVYIHGGSNNSGWAYEPDYHGHVLAQRDVVVVSSMSRSLSN